MNFEKLLLDRITDTKNSPEILLVHRALGRGLCSAQTAVRAAWAPSKHPGTKWLKSPTAAAWEFGLARQEARSTEDSAFGKGPGHYHQQNTDGSGEYMFQETCRLTRREALLKVLPEQGPSKAPAMRIVG